MEDFETSLCQETDSSNELNQGKNESLGHGDDAEGSMSVGNAFELCTEAVDFEGPKYNLHTES